MEMVKTAEDRQQKRLWWFYTITMLLCGVVYFTAQFARVSVMVYRRYIPMLVWAVMAIAFYRKDYRLRSAYGLGLAFLSWYVLTRWLQGDFYLNPSYNFFVEFCISYGLLFPFAMLCREGERRKAFDVMALLYVMLVVLMSVFSILCAVKRTAVQVPFAGFVFEVIDGQLWPLGLNPNVGAPMFNCGLFLLIYLLAAYKRKWMIAPGVILFLVIFSAGSLTVSRGGILGRSVGLAIVVCLLVSKIRISKKYLRIGVLLIAFFVSFFAFYKAGDASVKVMTGISQRIYAPEEAEVIAAEEEKAPEDEAIGAVEAPSEPVVKSRGLFSNIATFGSRAPIYAELMEGMQAKPSVWLIGCPDAEVMELLDEYKTYMTLHSSFFQTLALTGIPGLLMILLFCVIVFLAALKLLLDEKKNMGQRVLPVIMVPLVIHSLVESILFVPWTALGPIAIVNYVFMLCAGYTVEMAKGLKFKELLKIGG